MKATQSNKDARGLDDAALEEKIANAKNELMNLRFRKASGQLENTAQLQSIRKNIARMMTIQSEKRQAKAASAS